jgi:hypothetical protein
MPEKVKAEKVCPACGARNSSDTTRCVNCGADLTEAVDSSRTRFVDEDPELRHVDPENRIELERYERLDDAQLACGFLRANGIACELSSMPLPGLPADLILWVHRKNADFAWALLADAERQAQKDRGPA